MSQADRWQRVSELFDAALDRPSGERRRWLEEACGGDESLRREVEAMLAADERAEGVLERPPAGDAPALPPQGAAGGDNASPAAAPEPLAGEPAAGGRVGPYRLLREIGRGGMGVVYQAHDPRLDRHVALKFLPPHLAASAEATARFRNEARAASALDHPAVCTVYDVGTAEPGRLYLVLAYYEGETLADRLHRGPLPWPQAVELAAQVAEGLERAHEAGVVHRDVKPSNLLLVEGGARVKILDFGVAKLRASSLETGAGVQVGTLAYMAPEQAAGGAVDRRCDLWALGAVLYEMTTGRRPFGGDDFVALLEAIRRGAPAPLLVGCPEAPPALAAVVERCLEKDPDDRFPGAGELLTALGPLRREASRASGTGSAAGGDTAAGGGPDLRPGTLPAPLSRFVGRQRELRQVRELLAGSRLVTLTGPAGTGKTRLALEAARAVAGRFPDGVYFVPLEAVASAGLVPSAVAAALGVEESPGEAPAATLATRLAGARLLLLLDNFEQVVEAAGFVAGLLAACPGVRALVTSQTVLRVGGEHAFPLSPLPVPLAGRPTAGELAGVPAVELFVDRARAADPGFRLDDAAAAAVAELCRRLEGVPLAIELAASRVRLFTAAELLERLGGRLDLGGAGERDRPQRHRTLRQAIDWSHQLLSPAQQACFRRLGVFRGGFGLAAAERVVAPAAGESCERTVEALLDHSLVQPVAGEPGARSRFTLLETLREYALERLSAAGEEEAVRRAHAGWALELAERAAPALTGPEQAAWLDRLEAEHDNLRSALDWTQDAGEAESGLRLGAALWRFWLSRGHLLEGRERLERLLRLPGGEAPAAARAGALRGLATLAHNRGANRQARELLDRCLELDRQLGDEQGTGTDLNNLAWVACELSDLEVAERLSGEALELCRRLGDTRGEALALNNLGWVAAYRGDGASAAQRFRESLRLRRRLEDRRGIGFALANLAWAEGILGRHDAAREHLAEGREVLVGIGDRLLDGWVLTIEAMSSMQEGESARALELIEQAGPAWRHGANRSGVAWVESVLGWLAAAMGEPERAERLLASARTEWAAIGSLWGVSWTHGLAAWAALRRGDAGTAAREARSSLELRRRIGDRGGTADALDALAAALAAAADEPGLAGRCLGAAEAVREALGVPSQEPAASGRQSALGRLRRELGAEAVAAAVAAGREAPEAATAAALAAAPGTQD